MRGLARALTILSLLGGVIAVAAPLAGFKSSRHDARQVAPPAADGHRGSYVQVATADLPDCAGRYCDVAVMVVAYLDDHIVSRCFVHQRSGAKSALDDDVLLGGLNVHGPVRQLGLLFRVGDFVDDFDQRVSPHACDGTRGGHRMLEWVGSPSELTSRPATGSANVPLDVVCNLTRGNCGPRAVPRTAALSAPHTPNGAILPKQY